MNCDKCLGTELYTLLTGAPAPNVPQDFLRGKPKDLPEAAPPGISNDLSPKAAGATSKSSGKPSRGERLGRIQPGEEQSGTYELFCTECLQYTLGDSLTLWAEQNQTADDHAKRAAKGSLWESGKRILCLSDRELLQMADLKAGNGSPAEYLGQMLDDLLLPLEK